MGVNYSLGQSRHYFWASLALIAVLGIGGCKTMLNTGASGISVNQLNLDSEPLPDYQVGTKFIYSNGTWEKVKTVAPGWVKWVDHRNNVSIGNADFTYKRFQWETSKRNGTREFKPKEFLFQGATTTLWPLKVGNQTRFEESGKYYTEHGFERTYDSYWRCQVEGTQRVNVAAGEFDCWRIVCSRYRDNIRYTRGSNAREKKTWYYAPAVRHWVLETREYSGTQPLRRKELVAIVPDLKQVAADPETVRRIRKEFQNALEWNKSGVADSWIDPERQVAVHTMPRRTFRHAADTICRQYVQQISVVGGAHDYFGIACRDSKGRWQIPRR